MLGQWWGCRVNRVAARRGFCLSIKGRGYYHICKSHLRLCLFVLIFQFRECRLQFPQFRIFFINLREEKDNNNQNATDKSTSLKLWKNFFFTVPFSPDDQIFPSCSFDSSPSDFPSHWAAIKQDKTGIKHWHLEQHSAGTRGGFRPSKPLGLSSRKQLQRRKRSCIQMLLCSIAINSVTKVTLYTDARLYPPLHNQTSLLAQSSVTSLNQNGCHSQELLHI